MWRGGEVGLPPWLPSVGGRSQEPEFKALAAFIWLVLTLTSECRVAR